MRIDSHQHYWNFDPVKDAWITDEMQAIQRDFYPAEVWPLMQRNGIEGCVAVQADQSEAETIFLLDLARQQAFIKGVVGWIDLRSPGLEQRLDYFSQYPLLKGFRHIVQAEPDDAFLLRDDFCRGIRRLSGFDYTYDILIYPKHIKTALEFVRRFDEQRCMVDHIAKPVIKRREIEQWKADISGFKEQDHVYCKMAGLVTEGDWAHWTAADFVPYMDVILETFGPDRIVFGSDWPVCLTGASYDQICGLTEQLLHTLSADEQDKIWGRNAITFYNL